ncbi:MAG: TonB-dependent receptor [Alteromonadaceae bacterium]|nr:TonB-dependent receptor [Alteromonadaceae bacterium]
MKGNKVLWAAILLAGIPFSAVQAEEQVIRVYSSTIEDRFGDDKTQPSSTVSLTREEIEQQHVQNLQQVLQAIPGITTDESGGADVKIKIRGIENQRFMGEPPGVVIVIDGVPVFERTGRVNIDLDNIESIDVVKGGASYLFGEDALAGAVIIKTKRGYSQEGVSLEHERGSFGYKRSVLRAGGGTDNLQAHVQYADRSADGFYALSDSWAETLSGNVTWYPDAVSDLRFGFEKSDRDRDRNGSVKGVTQAHVDPKGNTAARDYTRNFDVDLARINLGYSRELSDSLSLRGLTYQYTDDTDFWSGPMSYDGTGARTTAVDDYKYDTDYSQTQRGLKLEVNHSRDRLGVLLGLDLRRDDTDNEVRALRDYRIYSRGSTTAAGTLLSEDEGRTDTGALFVELKYQLAQDTTLTTNVRHDRIEIDYRDELNDYGVDKAFNVNSWRLGLTHDLTPDSTLFASVSTGFRTPTISQLYRTDVSGEQAVANNPDLEPEESLTYELGLRQRFIMGGWPSALSASVFQVERDDFILDTSGQYSPDSASYDVTGQAAIYDNIGGTRTRGFEFQLTTEPHQDVAFDLSYTWLHAVFTRYDDFYQALGNPYGRFGYVAPASFNDPANSYTLVHYNNTGNKVPRVSPHQVNVRLHWFGIENLKVTSELDYRSTAWADEINQEKWDGRTLVNLMAEYTFPLGSREQSSLQLFMRINNLFDREYWIIARGINDSNGSPATGMEYDGVYNAEDLSIVPSTGRNWQAGIRYRF